MKQSKWTVTVTFHPNPVSGETYSEPTKIIRLSPMERARAEEKVAEIMFDIGWEFWSAEYERST